jgi:hypothetical protein
MVDTPRTQATLLGTTFVGGGGANVIGSQNERDLVVSIPMPNIIHAPFRPEFPPYNCKFDNSTNDTTGWTALFADVTTRGYGEIIMPDGTSLITPNTLAIPSFCYMHGRGKDSSVIQAANTTAGWLMKTAGTVTTQAQSITLQDFALVRSATDTGGVLKLWYTQDADVERLHIYGNQDFAIQMLQTWDTSISHCLIETCGGNATGNRNTTINAITGVAVGSEVIQILGGIAASGDGSSTGNSNHIRLIGNSISGFSAGLMTIAQGANGPSTTAYDVFVQSNHFEALSAAGLSFTGQYVIGIDGTNNHIVFRDNFLGIDAVAAGSGTDRRGSMVMISCAAGFSTNMFDGLDYQIPAASTFSAVIDGFTGGFHAYRLHNSGNFWPSTAVVTYSSNAPVWGDIPITTGVLPVSPYVNPAWQPPATNPVTFAATTTFDLANVPIQTITLTGAVTFANPTHMPKGSSGSIVIRQDGTGSRVATWGTNWKFVGASKTLTTTANAIDRVDWVYDGTTLMCQLLKAFA